MLLAVIPLRATLPKERVNVAAPKLGLLQPRASNRESPEEQNSAAMSACRGQTHNHRRMKPRTCRAMTHARIDAGCGSDSWPPKPSGPGRPDGAAAPGRRGPGPDRPTHPLRRTLVAAAALPFLLATLSCSPSAPSAPALDSAKVASIVVGRSSRNDVFAALGQPARTERSSLGEVWFYQPTSGGTGGSGLMSGASAASGILGAFVPYAGVVGSGLGLAGATGGTRPAPPSDSLSVTFRDDGVVRDCTFSSATFPAAGPASAAALAKVVDCQRPERGDPIRP